MPRSLTRIGCSSGAESSVLSGPRAIAAGDGRGVRLLELNLDRSQGSHWFDETRLGKAIELVPAWVGEVIG